MSLPQVAIVGRPNVGKSSLLNALVGRRVSIVHDRPGVTRDRVAVEMAHEGRVFSLVDMGGIGIVDDQNLDAHVEQQINSALAGADVMVFVVDVRAGLMPLDEQIASALRKTGRPTVLLANKVDGERHSLMVEEFSRLGLGRALEVSAVQCLGLTDLLSAVVAGLPEPRGEEKLSEEGETRIALLGQRNAGKSSILNALAGEERVIVSEIPGTTRDAVDVKVSYGERSFTVIDTAGMRKSSRLQDSVEFYSQQRSLSAITRADVALHVIDATKEISQVDKKLAEEIVNAWKPCVIVVNKWDLAAAIDPDTYIKYLGTRLPQLHYAPVIFVSATERIRLKQMVDLAFDLHDQSKHRVSTSEINRIVEESEQMRGPRVGRGKFPKIFFATQVGTTPPWIVLFVNDPTLFPDDFRRFLENRLRQALPFKEIPIRISFRARRSIFDRGEGSG